MTRPDAPTPPAAGPRGWRAYHLFYHAPLDVPLRLWVAPLCASLLADGEISGFYFVRYVLGGPHVRLRVRPRPGRAAAVDARVQAAGRAFLAHHPSPTPLDVETIHRNNQGVLSVDPGAAPHAAWSVPDNTLLAAPVEFEVERYGGPRLFGASVNAFSLSSIHVLRLLARTGEVTPAVRLAEGWRAMLRLAWGLAPGVDDVAGLAAWATGGYVGSLDAFAARGDEAFERGRDAWCERVRGELTALAEGGGTAGDDVGAPGWLGGTAAALAREVGGAGPETRWRIAWSHLHMTANRLGLRTPEEVYVGRMLQRALHAMAEDDPSFWRSLDDAHRALRDAAPRPSLRDRARAALAAFAAETPADPA